MGFISEGEASLHESFQKRTLANHLAIHSPIMCSKSTGVFIEAISVKIHPAMCSDTAGSSEGSSKKRAVTIASVASSDIVGTSFTARGGGERLRALMALVKGWRCVVGQCWSATAIKQL